MARSFDANSGRDRRNDNNREEGHRRGNGSNNEMDDASCQSLEEIADEAEEGRQLYLGLVREEIQRNGINEPLLFPDEGWEHLTPTNRSSWFRFWELNLDRHDFHQLTNELSVSSQREMIRRQAQELVLESLDMHHFYGLMEGLFQGGVDRERIAILFFFCSDVAIAALRRGLRNTFYLLLDWSLSFIATRVALWVHRHGGWGAVLRTSLTIAYQISACCAFVAVAVVCAMYIRRQLQ